MKYDAVLKNWSINFCMTTKTYYLIGICFDDTRNRFEDYRVIQTSSLREINFDKGYGKTRSSIYKLSSEKEKDSDELKAINSTLDRLAVL